MNEPHRLLIEDKYGAFKAKYPDPTNQQIEDFLGHIRLLCSDDFFQDVRRAVYQSHGIFP